MRRGKDDVLRIVGCVAGDPHPWRACSLTVKKANGALVRQFATEIAGQKRALLVSGRKEDARSLDGGGILKNDSLQFPEGAFHTADRLLIHYDVVADEFESLFIRQAAGTVCTEDDVGTPGLHLQC